MRKKGFTLIELLAVIVILAIIALIAVPIVINIINDSKYESQKRSIDLYAEALKQTVANYQLKNNKKVEGKFNTTDGKTLTRDDTTLNVDYKGNVVCNRIVVNKDGSIYLSECTVDGDKVYISKEESKKENPSYYEYGKTEYGMIMENKDHSSKFLNTGIYGGNIYQFTIFNTLDIEDKDAYESSDCSYNKDGSVICYWKEVENKPSYYSVILASDGEMYTPYDSSYLFSQLGHQSLQNDLDVSKLNTKYTTNMSYMFENAGACNSYYQKIILGDKFDTSKVTNMSYMFADSQLQCHGSFRFSNSFNTKNVTNMSHMFYDVNLYGTLDLGSNFDTSNVTDMSFMFYSLDYTSNLILGEKFDTSKVTNMSAMFSYLGSNQNYFNSLNLGEKFDTSNVISMDWMFALVGRKSLESLSLGEKFNTSNVTNMSHMFDSMGADKLKKLDLGENFNTLNVTNMDCMFCSLGYKNLEELNLGDHFDTSKVTNMHQMFSGTGYKKLTKLDLGKSFFAPQGNYSSVSYMFSETGKESLKELYLWNFDYSKAWYYSRDYVFKDCGTDGMLTKVVVSSEDIKTKILNNSSTPQFWKDNNIIQVQSN